MYYTDKKKIDFERKENENKKYYVINRRSLAEGQ